MANRKITCTGCDYVSMIRPRRITLNYYLPEGGVVKGYRRVAWCNSCSDITDAEALFDVAEIKAELGRIEAERPNFFVRLVDRALGGGDRSREERAEYEAQLQFLKLRKSGPRCLECCGTQIQPLNVEESGTLHTCGGRLIVEDADQDTPRMTYRPEVVSMDVEGNRLRQAS